MSWKALTWASAQTCRTSSEKFVLIMLANHGDEQNTCYPSVEKLAADTQLGASTVRRCITHLAVDGKIRVLQRWGARGSRRSNRYQLLLDGPDTALPEHDDWQREYEYVPKGDESDGGDPPEGDPEGIPLDLSGMPDQGVHTACSEQTARIERYIPLDASGYSKKEVNLHKEPPPTPQAAAAAEDPNNLEERLTACVDDVAAARPEWSRRRVVAALHRALSERGDPAIVFAAARLVAADRQTRVPGRLNEDGEWWGKAVVDVGRSGPVDAKVWCEVHPVKHPQGTGCPRCMEEAEKTAQRGSDGAGGATVIDDHMAAWLPSSVRERLTGAVAS